MSTESSRSALGRGVAWLGGVRWAAQIVSWASTLLVVRLLRPEDYGIVGMATTYVQIAQVVTEFGVGTAVQARANLGKVEIAEANTLTLYLGIAGVLLSFAVAYPLAAFFGEPRVVGVVFALSPLCITGALAAVPSAVLMRELKYKESAMIDLARSVLSSLSVLVLALAGVGYWALIGAQLIGAVVPLTLLLVRYAQPFRRLTRAGIGPIVAFSREVLIGRLAWISYQSAHFAIAGRVLGTVPLGQYSFGWTIATLPGEKLSTVVSSVLPSVLGTVRDNRDEQWRYMRASIEPLSLVMIPALCGMIATAPDFVRVAFGEKWIDAVLSLQLLSLYAMLQWFLPLLNQILLISGDVKFQRRNGLLFVSIVIPAFFIGARWWGLPGLCLAWILTWPVSAVPLIRLAMARLDRRPSDLWNAMSVGVCGGLLSCAIVISVRAVVHRLGYGAGHVLAIGVPLSIFAHLGLVMYARPSYLVSARDFVRQRLKRRSA